MRVAAGSVDEGRDCGLVGMPGDQIAFRKVMPDAGRSGVAWVALRDVAYWGRPAFLVRLGC